MLSRSARRLLRVLAVPLLVVGTLAGMLASATLARAGGAPTIASDQADYPPGATVTLSGTNWDPAGSAVHLAVDDSDGQTWSYTNDVSPGADGSVSDSFALPTYFIADYSVTATQDSAGGTLSASTTFTDSSANIDQCVNGGVGDTPQPCEQDTYRNWVNGNANGQKAHWAEGDFLPYRTTVGPVAAGSHTLGITYKTVAQSLHAFDYLGSFDATETTSSTPSFFHANGNDPVTDILGAGYSASSPTGTFPIPAATLVNCGGSTGTVPTQVPGTMDIWGPAGTAITAITYSAENVLQGSNDCNTSVSITFTVGGSGNQTVVLAWGGHIAVGSGLGGWGDNTGASTINGSPYHMSLDKLDGHSQGSQDRQLQAGGANGAIVPGSTVTIIKNTDTGDGTFGYSTTGGSFLPSTFDITTVGTTGQQSYSDIVPGTYTVDETSTETGYSFFSLSCSASGTDTTAGTSGSEATISFPLTGGGSVTCTYVNHKNPNPPQLIVQTLVTNNDGGTAGPSDFTMNVSGTNASPSQFSGDAQGVNVDLDAGSYSVTETQPSGPHGYAVTYSADCSGTIADGETKTCTVTNDDFALSRMSDSSMCKFDTNPSRANSQFKLIYAPDPTTSKSRWTLAAQSPGGYAYNVFYNGTTSPTTLHLTIPYPFVTVGATPVHVYSDASWTYDSHGHTRCVVPGTPIGSASTQIALGDYGSQSMGASKTIDVSYTSPTGFAYIRVDLAYGLNGSGNYAKNASNDALDGTTLFKTIRQDQGYTFSYADTSQVSMTRIVSENYFKTDSGIGGLLVKGSTGNPVANATVKIFASNGTTLLGTVTTDAEGWYTFPYTYSGSPTTFVVKLPAYGQSHTVTLSAPGFIVTSFTV